MVDETGLKILPRNNGSEEKTDKSSLQILKAGVQVISHSNANGKGQKQADHGA